MDHRSHVRRVALLLIVLLVVGFVLQRMARPASFGEQGYYRADALAEIG